MTNFRAMTWNVENLFRPRQDATEEKKQRYQDKLGLLAGVIGDLSPDVVGLQEVGSDGALEDLQGALEEAYPHRQVSAFPDRRGIRVAFISKHGIEEKEDVVEFPEGPALDVHDITPTGEAKPVKRMGRGALRVRVMKEGLRVDVISAHLKSKLLTFPRSWGASFTPRDEGERAQVAGIALQRRAAEAVTLRIWVNGLLGSEDSVPLLLLGDLNDVPAAQTSLMLNGPPGSQIGTRGFNRPDKGDATRLFNLSPLIEEERRYSRIQDGRKELLDQILASADLLPAGDDGRRRLPAVDSHVDFRDGLPSVENDPGRREKDVAPDHAPVVASFEVPGT